MKKPAASVGVGAAHASQVRRLSSGARVALLIRETPLWLGAAQVAVINLALMELSWWLLTVPVVMFAVGGWRSRKRARIMREGVRAEGARVSFGVFRYLVDGIEYEFRSMLDAQRVELLCSPEDPKACVSDSHIPWFVEGNTVYIEGTRWTVAVMALAVLSVGSCLVAVALTMG